MMPERLFEPTVIFFGLTNLPTVFQTIMNKILRDLINTRKVAMLSYLLCLIFSSFFISQYLI